MALFEGIDSAKIGWKEIGDLLTQGITKITWIGMSAAVIVLIWGAIQYFWGGTSGEGKVSKGKQIILWAIIGIAVIILAQIIVLQVLKIIEPAKPPAELFQ